MNKIVTLITSFLGSSSNLVWRGVQMARFRGRLQQLLPKSNRPLARDSCCTCCCVFALSLAEDWVKVIVWRLCSSFYWVKVLIFLMLQPLKPLLSCLHRIRRLYLCFTACGGRECLLKYLRNKMHVAAVSFHSKKIPWNHKIFEMFRNAVNNSRPRSGTFYCQRVSLWFHHWKHFMLAYFSVCWWSQRQP